MEINQDLIMQWGLMNKLSTGNAWLDTILVMLVPLLVNQLFPYAREFFGNICARWQHRPDGEHHERTIVHKQKDYYDTDEDMPNHKLQQAIMIHLNNLPEVFSQLETADVRLAKAKRIQAATSNSNGSSGWFDDEADTESQYEWYPGIELEDFEVKLVPPLDTWVVIQPGLKFMRSEQQITRDKETENITTYTLLGKSAEQVDDFISAAYDSYRAMLKGEQRDKTADRYLHLPMLSKTKDDDHITYRRYKLSDEKSFANFFHPEKEALLALVDNFTHKKGKFAIQGYPQKLGFLLHGPPGTGKTTFIKALAAHTKRSIINIPLSRIKTNQQLMDMMMDEKIKVEGEDMRVPLPFHKVIYVMEDIDAASHVVQKRSTTPDTMFASALAKATATTTTTTEVKLKAQQAGGVLTRAASVTHEKEDACLLQDVDLASPQALGPTAGPKSPVAAWLSGGSSGSDALDLAGLLNVLDGVVDTPGRIVVMSTNHPEKLDPALIRPGRINRKVYLGHIASTEALHMIQHYFGQLTQQQEQQLVDRWVDNTVSPATLEALCAEHDAVETLLAAVHELTAAAAAPVAAAAVEVLQSTKAAAAQQQQQQQQRLRSCGRSIEIQAFSGSAAAATGPSPFSAAAITGVS